MNYVNKEMSTFVHIPHHPHMPLYFYNPNNFGQKVMQTYFVLLIQFIGGQK